MEHNAALLAQLTRGWAWFDAVDARRQGMAHWLRDDRISIKARVSLAAPTSDEGRRTDNDIQGLGSVGCYLSHMAIWQGFLHSSDDVLLVMEDDAVLPPHMWDVLTGSRTAPPPEDVDMVTLSSVTNDAHPHHQPWTTPVHFLNTHAYFLTRRGAATLVAHALPIQQSVDHFILRLAQLGYLRVLAHHGVVATQYDSGVSDVATKECALCGMTTRGTRVGFGDHAWLFVEPGAWLDLCVLGLVMKSMIVLAFVWRRVVTASPRRVC